MLRDNGAVARVLVPEDAEDQGERGCEFWVRPAEVDAGNVQRVKKKIIR